MIQSRLTKYISTLEQKQTYLKPVPLNADVVCTSHIVRMGKDIVFFEASLTLAGSDEVLVRASQTALMRPIVRKAKM